MQRSKPMSAEQAAAEEREKSRAFMKTPSEWPQWPILPIKKRDPKGGFPICHVLFELRGELHMAKVNMYELTGATPSERVDVDALIADGWVVD